MHICVCVCVHVYSFTYICLCALLFPLPVVFFSFGLQNIYLLRPYLNIIFSGKHVLVNISGVSCFFPLVIHSLCVAFIALKIVVCIFLFSWSVDLLGQVLCLIHLAVNISSRKVPNIFCYLLGL